MKRNGFSEKVKDEAFRRSGGRCECLRAQCDHGARCQARLKRSSDHSQPDAATAAQFHHRRSAKSGGSGIVDNCEVLCKPCHKRTRSYGDH
ncbi:HNH endonuclease [Ferrimicrobium sp.]|uniref:HNH endonuclease n=1 Tax=Ferrimicrobium sp. TaxID=2926050 RepID=UPI00344D7460